MSVKKWSESKSTRNRRSTAHGEKIGALTKPVSNDKSITSNVHPANWPAVDCSRPETVNGASSPECTPTTTVPSYVPVVALR